MEDFCEIINEEMVSYAKDMLLIDIIISESSQEIAQEVANQYIYIGRRTLRTEQARRVSQFSDVDTLKLIGRKYFQGKVNFFIFWGFTIIIEMLSHKLDQLE